MSATNTGTFSDKLLYNDSPAAAPAAAQQEAHRSSDMGWATRTAQLQREQKETGCVCFGWRVKLQGDSCSYP
jgi:hypothetical protein